MGANPSKYHGGARFEDRARLVRGPAPAPLAPPNVRDAGRINELNLALVRTGFRAYYWYPRGAERPAGAAPPAPPGVYRHPYPAPREGARAAGARAADAPGALPRSYGPQAPGPAAPGAQLGSAGGTPPPGGYLYTNSKAPPQVRNGADLGRLLGYLHPYEGGWGSGGIWVTWYALAKGVPLTRLWAEALPSAEGGRIPLRQMEIEEALGDALNTDARVFARVVRTVGSMGDAAY
ncbi:MAG: hypothetical protein EBU46_19505 [Nitrosomonadaceae bacterium]|nr:hypothetical protein [Nitrosomonadaceae bacterium]